MSNHVSVFVHEAFFMDIFEKYTTLTGGQVNVEVQQFIRNEK